MRRQSGQAIVLIAIMLAVLVGMAALAIDGSRAYQSKRSLQAAVDAASLAGADTLQQTRNFVTAEQAATASFSSNRRLYTAPGCAPGYGTPGAAPLTITCTYSDGTVLTQVVAQLGAAGYSFTLTATRSLSLQFGRILTNGASPIISARAVGSVDNLLYSPTIAALSQAGCGGAPGTAITVNGTGQLQITGDVVSSGAISVASGSVQATGDVYARCQASVPGFSMKCYPSGSNPGCTYPDVLGVTRSGYRFVDPNYVAPVVVGGSQSAVGTNVVMLPGTYAANPNFVGGDCWFLKAGVYYWQGGYTNNGDFVSNELKPPDEPMINNNSNVSPKQFWNGDGAQCAGSYQLSTFNGPDGLPHVNWAIVVTSVRSDTYNGVNYTRESAPSVCRTVRTNPGNDVIKLDVSNVPGATSYNVYVTRAGGDCSGPWGLVENVPVVGTVSNANTNPCPAFNGNGCTLGHESAIIDDNDIINLFAPNVAAAWGAYGSYPPSPETSPLGGNLPNENANRTAPPAGDKANENECLTVGGAQASCPSAITPGAVSYVIPNGACLNDTSNGDTYVFGGYQYDWMLVYEPGPAYPPANACANNMGAATDTAYIGLVYMPSASLTITKASSFRTDETGGVIANTVTFTGQLPTIIGNDAYSPVQPGSRLTS